MKTKWYMGDHLMINELVSIGDHHKAIEKQHGSVGFRFNNIDRLKFTSAAKENFGNSPSGSDVICLLLGNPQIHRRHDKKTPNNDISTRPRPHF
jgi:hypothetical protein